MRIYNCHTHIFNFNCAPNGFLRNYFSKAVAEVAGRLLRVRWMRRPLGWLIDRMPFTKKYAALVQVGTRESMDLVFADLASHYPDDTAFVVLTIDFDHMAAGEAPAGYATQLELMKEVKRKHRDTCLPFLFVDPRHGSMGEMKDMVERYFDPAAPSGFVGLKLYPSLGYYPFDHNLQGVYAVAAKKRIPIMTHCTRAGIYYVKEPMGAGMATPISFNPTPRVAQRHTEDQYKYDDKKKNEEFCNNFLDPVNYLDVLGQHPDLKICIAHYGGDDEMIKDPGPDNWYTIVRNELLVAKYPNMYADVSYTLANDKSWPLIQRDLQDPVLRHRLLFGTDYFMTLKEPYTERQLYERLRNFLSPADWERIANINPRRYLTSDVYAAP